MRTTVGLEIKGSQKTKKSDIKKLDIGDIVRKL